MVVVVIVMVLLIGVAVWVVGMVAVPARREGRDLLTERGEQLVAKVPGLDVLTSTPAESQPAERTPEHASAA